MSELPPEMSLLGEAVSWWAERRPDAEALIHGETRWSYETLNWRIARLAQALAAAGVTRGDRVATLQTPHPDYVVAMLATARLGAIWVGLNPRYQLEELLHVVKDSRPKLLLTRSCIADRSYAGEIAVLTNVDEIEGVVVFEGDPSLPGTIPMAEFLAAGDRAGVPLSGPADGDDPCIIVYTSGSTGKPKGAVLSHQGLSRFARNQNLIWPMQQFRAVNYFPINHVGCVADLTLPVLYAGGALIFLEKFEPRACLSLMEQERVTFWGSVPSVFQMILALPDFDSFDLSALELIVWEGAPAPAELIERLRAIHPRLATNYGMTETTSAITALAATSDLELLANSVGEPFPGVEIRLERPDGQLAEEGEIGEILARSRYNMLSYWGQPEATAAAFTEDGFFRTGDLAICRPDGRYRIVGRLKEMYKSGGYNVYPREVEAVLEQHPAVAMAAVVARPDPLWQEVGVAFVAPNFDVSAEVLDRHCRAHLADYKVPKLIVIEPDPPLLPIGKIDKPALRTRALSLT